ncbi:arca-like protein [Colletotrichum kahawae]|uniref:Arca-like protein n=1 Tax=Colletotrichum kahawae TaxID=34407 RepID=A0AAD9Y1V9_COLKA|nr:arca-like protein [Colletotrichum kahawae]
MVIIKQFNPAAGGEKTHASRLRMSSRACHRCRTLHKKCDIQSRGRTCSNCEAGGASCRGGGTSELQIRFSGLSHQVDEVPDTCPSSKTRSRTRGDRRRSNRPLLAATNNDGSLGVVDASWQSASEAPPLIEEEASVSTHTHNVDDGSAQASLHPQLLPSHEAKLVKHFFTTLIPWFDYCWPSGPFGSYIKSTLRQDPGILYAVLAVSARYLEAVRSEEWDSNEYERKCLGILIPMLNDRNVAEPQGDGVLVSALLLRLLDEMTDPSDSQLVIRHTVSAPVLLRMRQHNLQPTELSNAAMTIVLRQEIFVANMVKRPVELLGEDCGIDGGLGLASDVIWAHRMTAHAARVTNFAYGNEPRTTDIRDHLWGYLDSWDQAKPSSFEPLNEFDGLAPEDQASTFPAIYYIHDCAVSGRQYLEICKIILLAHDPRTPSLGLGRASYVRAQEEKIRQSVRTVCGIWMSNEEYVPARVLVGLAIGIAGELFTNPAETRQLCKIVLEAERHVGWPCLKVSPSLQAFWGLNDTDVTH